MDGCKSLLPIKYESLHVYKSIDDRWLVTFGGLNWNVNPKLVPFVGEFTCKF